MTCAHCEELQERIAWLEDELGLQRRSDVLQRVRTALLIPRTTRHNPPGATGAASLVLALHAARGRTVTTLQLMEAVPPFGGGEDERDSKIIAVMVCYARKTLGRQSIENVWGKGYRMTASGMAAVSAILAGDAVPEVLAA